MQFVSQLLNGLQLGSIYALVALGYTMVYGIVKLINFAHGDLIMVGSYVTLLLMRRALSLIHISPPAPFCFFTTTPSTRPRLCRRSSNS